jgi:hypothetical protein
MEESVVMKFTIITSNKTTLLFTAIDIINENIILVLNFWNYITVVKNITCHNVKPTSMVQLLCSRKRIVRIQLRIPSYK